jgi:hypothetical protein
VLHHATELAGIARTGTMPPYVTALSGKQEEVLLPVVEKLQMSDKLQFVDASQNNP